MCTFVVPSHIHFLKSNKNMLAITITHLTMGHLGSIGGEISVAHIES